tara:strand:+ start:108 stop:491 length:384 start_codon:yes stop_codon:yes gene_type:complete
MIIASFNGIHGKATFLPLNTNTRELNYQVSTKAIFEIIKQNPEGLTLTEIAQKVDPDWTPDDCKRQFKRAIDPLLCDDRVRKIQVKSDKRVKLYYPTKLSKRYVFKALVNSFLDAKNNFAVNNPNIH